MDEARVNVEYPHGICVNWQISWMIMNWKVILILYSYLEWFIRLSDPPLSLWEFSPQLSLSFGRSYRVRLRRWRAFIRPDGRVRERGRSRNLSNLRNAFLWAQGEGLGCQSSAASSSTVKVGGAKTEGDEISRLLEKSIKTDSRSYLSLVVY